jgi:hypothetical protein
MRANRKPLTAVRVGEVLHRLNGIFGHTRLSNLTPWQIEQVKNLAASCEASTTELTGAKQASGNVSLSDSRKPGRTPVKHRALLTLT